MTSNRFGYGEDFDEEFERTILPDLLVCKSCNPIRDLVIPDTKTGTSSILEPKEAVVYKDWAAI